MNHMSPAAMTPIEAEMQVVIDCWRRIRDLSMTAAGRVVAHLAALADDEDAYYDNDPAASVRGPVAFHYAEVPVPDMDDHDTGGISIDLPEGATGATVYKNGTCIADIAAEPASGDLVKGSGVDLGDAPAPAPRKLPRGSRRFKIGALTPGKKWYSLAEAHALGAPSASTLYAWFRERRIRLVHAPHPREMGRRLGITSAELERLKKLGCMPAVDLGL